MEAHEKEQQAVVAYIRREDGKMLALVDKRGYSAPGGKVEPDERKHPIWAIKRETWEEVGIEIESCKLVFEGLHTSGRRVFAYLVESYTGVPEAREFGTRIEWVDPSVIANEFGAEYHQQALRAAGIWNDEPWEVVVKGRDLVLGYACPICKIFHGATIYVCRWEEALVAAREAAERCCNRKCEDCEKRVDRKHYVVCNDCGQKRDVAREQERFDKAQKIPESDYDGWFYFANEYHASVDEIEEYCLENELNWPDWVWACKPIKFRIDVDTILEHALQDHYEDARSSIPQAAEDKLQAMLDEWCAGQKIESWQEDNSRAVILKPREVVADDD